jgi:hypothetical protein
MGGFGRPLVWRFVFGGSISVRFQLRQAREDDVQGFLAAIGLSGSAERLTLELLRASS